MNSLAEVLKARFPWLGTTDEDDVPYPGGADTIQDLETFYGLLVKKPAADPLQALRDSVGAVLHELTVGEASEGNVYEIKTCARLLAEALGVPGLRPPAVQIGRGKLKCPYCKKRGVPVLIEDGYTVTHELISLDPKKIRASGWDGSSRGVSEGGDAYFLECSNCFAHLPLPEGMEIEWK
jgi:hypothetical protein